MIEIDCWDPEDFINTEKGVRICVRGLIEKSWFNYEVDDVVKFERIKRVFGEYLGIRVLREFKKDLEELF